MAPPWDSDIGKGELKKSVDWTVNRYWVPNVGGRCGLLSSRMEVNPSLDPAATYIDESRPRITTDSATNLIQLWPKYEESSKNVVFRRAASRYCMSLDRDAAEDAIVDHWVALEALFGSSSAIGTTVAYKLALLLETKIAIRKSLREEVREHYKIRNKLVHGGDYSPALREFDLVIRTRFKFVQQMSIEVAAFFSRDWVRRSLVRLVEHFESLQELDDVLIEGKLRYDVEREIKALPPLPAFLKRMELENR